MAGPAPLPPPPSAARLAAAAAAALFIASVITIVAVLPAEYGVDPTGAGAALGLLPAPPPEAESPESSEAGTGLTPTVLGPINYYTTPYATDQTTLELGPYEYVEYKYRLEQGASLHFAWESSATVLHDFHAEPDDEAAGPEVSFDKMDRARGFGTHTAPFAGMHGWFWENPGPNPITVTLSTSGFYTAAMEYRPNRIRHPHQIQRPLP